MPISQEIKQRLPWLIIAAVVLIYLIVNFFYDPEQTTWSPKCILLQLTGFKCPGCGSQRFAYHLMHGDILGAIHYNYFIALLSPYLLLLLSGELLPSRRWRQYVHTHFVTKLFGFSYISLYFIWWVLRNILNL